MVNFYGTVVSTVPCIRKRTFRGTLLRVGQREAGGIESGRSTLALCLAAGLSLMAALIHLWEVPQHFLEWWGYGAFFLVLASFQGTYGVALLRWPRRSLLLSGVAGNLAIVGSFVMVHTEGVPFLGPHAGVVHQAGALGVACTIMELVLVVALLSLARAWRATRVYVVLGAVQAFGTGLILHLLQSRMYEAYGLEPAMHWLQGSFLNVPLFALVAWFGTATARCLLAQTGFRDGPYSGLTWALVVAVPYAAVSVPANGLAMRHVGTDSFPAIALGEAGVVLGATFLLMLAVAALCGVPWEEPKLAGLWRPRSMVTVLGLATGLLVVASPALLEPSSAAAQQAPASCSSSSYDRSYAVAAINVEIPFNRWGNFDEHGQIYVLQDDKEAVKNWSRPLAANPADDPARNRRLRPRPLVIRANAGECVRIDFTNELDAVGGGGLPNDPRSSIKVFGPSYDAQTSDGSAVGYNADTTVGMGETISYFWRAPDEEGLYLFRDQGALAGAEANSGSLAHGLYGGFAVEPAGSTWTDPTTGEPLYAGAKDHVRITKESGDPYVDADIHPPGAKSFRETVQISQDELPGGTGFAFNYGAEPARNRVATNPAGDGGVEQRAPDAVGEETSLSSWTYGDPALIKLASGKGPWLPKPDGEGGRTSPEDCGLEKQQGGSCYVSNVTHAYPGDPTRFRYGHAGPKETHVFHMHAHQWRIEPNDPDSTTIDSQTYGPGESFTAELIGGAGSKPGTFGDSIFHCHLYPHFADGFWALFRVHDVLEDGTGQLPDGTGVHALKPLPDRAAPASPTADNPGYPRFIPGKHGWRAPQPPGGISEPSGNPDDPGTVEREDLTPATRMVAGKLLDTAKLEAADPNSLAAELAGKLAVEQSVIGRNAGADFNPGAPFTDPCPSGAREVTYNVSVIQADVIYNEAGWHDKQARIMVPTKDVGAILAGKKEPEPLFIRVNAGDCINFNLTNRLPNWFGGDEFQKLVQTNMYGGHIHLVKFDVLASDGSSNGWNYQQAAFSKEQAEFNERVAAGQEPCNLQGCRLPRPASWDPATAGAPTGQTIHERWYADTELRTAFLHDHHFAALEQNRGLFGALIVEPGGTDFRNSRSGEFYQPVDNPSHGAPCRESCEGTSYGTAMDVIGPGENDDFREFGLSVQDFVSLHKSDAQGGAPINAPGEPEEFPDADPGTMAINYKNAPFVLRQEKDGRPTDPAHVFSSTVHGDPMTPILEAYSEDPVRVRLIQGSHEEQHVFTMHGVRWRQEPDDPESPLVNTQAIGVSEAFNFEVPKMTCGADDETCAGDYLYSTTGTGDLYLGVWGLLRARGKEVPSLLPLPDNANPNEAKVSSAPTATVPRAEGSPSGTTAPPDANSPGNPCPTGAPVKKFNVVAMQQELQYNEEGDHDPHGLIYALAEDEAAIKSGAKKPEPLVLRANEGDCIEVRLTNHLGQGWLDGHPDAGTDGDPTLPTEPIGGTRSGLRVSLHPQLVKYDVRGSDGTAVGYNRDQTVAPGDSRLYRWYADDPGKGELGATNLTEFGDVRGHRHHGLFAGLNIEPKGSTHHDPTTGEPIRSGASADIRVPGSDNDFREFSLFFQDGLNLREASGAIIEDPLDHPPTPEEPEGEGLDPEDQGEKGFNYSNAPFRHRIGDVPAEGMDGAKIAGVFSSRVHGDPDTPIFRAFAGNKVRMRVLQGSDKPRQHSFQVSGHAWRAQPGDPDSNLIGTQGGISVGSTFDLHLPSAGGPGAFPGDYRYGSGTGFHHLPGGLWGIMRVYPQPPAGSALRPTEIGETDDPMAGGHPILPLEVSATGTSVSLSARPSSVDFGKSTTLSGKLSAGEKALAGRSVVLEHRPSGAKRFARLGARTTGKGGAFAFAGIRPKEKTDYRVRFAGNPGAGLEPSTSPARRVNVRAVLSLRTSANSLQAGKRLRISGTVAPAHARSFVRLAIEHNGKAIKRVNRPLDNGSRYGFAYRPGMPGRYEITAVFRKHADHLGDGATKKVRVHRKRR